MTAAAKPSLAARQALLAKFIAEPSFERWLRENPADASEQYQVPAAYVQWLVHIPAPRLRQFRRSRVHKDRVRKGIPPKAE